MTIGEKIHTLRTAKGLTLEDVAKFCNTTRQTIYKYEKGMIKRIPSDNIERMAILFGVLPTDIMGWSDNPLDVLVEQIVHEETLQDKLVEITNDFTDDDIALVIEYALFIKGRRKKNG